MARPVVQGEAPPPADAVTPQAAATFTQGTFSLPKTRTRVSHSSSFGTCVGESRVYLPGLSRHQLSAPPGGSSAAAEEPGVWRPARSVHSTHALSLDIEGIRPPTGGTERELRQVEKFAVQWWREPTGDGHIRRGRTATGGYAKRQ